MAHEAARLLEGTRWLPEVLRYPADEIPVEAAPSETAGEATIDDNPTETVDVDLPAFLTEEVDARQAPADPDKDGGEHLEAAE